MAQQTISYWWLNANPSIWKFEAKQVGDIESYSTHNDAGNKRRIFQWFHKVKPGDLVVGYVTSPEQRVVAICEITRGLPSSKKMGTIEFRKIEQLENPIPLEILKKVPELRRSEPLTKRRGSLFRLTKREFSLIRRLEKPKNQLFQDFAQISADRKVSKTTKQSLFDARIGQGKFGILIRQMWGNRCAVTGLTVGALLEASHIKSWAKSTNAQRLDPHNGLLLTANMHRLFDAGLIAFLNSGRMLISSDLSISERRKLCLLGQQLKKRPSERMAKYLAYHRRHVFQ